MQLHSCIVQFSTDNGMSYFSKCASDRIQVCYVTRGTPQSRGLSTCRAALSCRSLNAAGFAVISRRGVQPRLVSCAATLRAQLDAKYAGVGGNVGALRSCCSTLATNARGELISDQMPLSPQGLDQVAQLTRRAPVGLGALKPPSLSPCNFVTLAGR